MPLATLAGGGTTLATLAGGGTTLGSFLSLFRCRWAFRISTFWGRFPAAQADHLCNFSIALFNACTLWAPGFCWMSSTTAVHFFTFANASSMLKRRSPTAKAAIGSSSSSSTTSMLGRFFAALSPSWAMPSSSSSSLMMAVLSPDVFSGGGNASPVTSACWEGRACREGLGRGSTGALGGIMGIASSDLLLFLFLFLFFKAMQSGSSSEGGSEGGGGGMSASPCSCSQRIDDDDDDGNALCLAMLGSRHFFWTPMAAPTFLGTGCHGSLFACTAIILFIAFNGARVDLNAAPMGQWSPPWGSGGCSMLLLAAPSAMLLQSASSCASERKNACTSASSASSASSCSHWLCKAFLSRTMSSTNCALSRAMSAKSCALSRCALSSESSCCVCKALHVPLSSTMSAA